MNLFDSTFLCLDIGTYGVRGLAHRIRNARMDQSAFFTVDSPDTTFAIKSVVDELERQLGAHFDSAYITGNFGPSHFDMSAKNSIWDSEHKITETDIRNQISQITAPDGYFPMHIVPLRYDSPQSRNMPTPIGHTDFQLISAFGSIFYTQSGLNRVHQVLRNAHIQPDGFFDPHFLHNSVLRQQKQNTMFIDFGAQYTSASIWTDRGPVWHTKIPIGGTTITNTMCEKLGLDPESADRIKRTVSTLIPSATDHLVPADRDYGFSRSDVNDIVLPIMVDIISQIKDTCTTSFTRYKPTKIILTGGGSQMAGLGEFIENAFAVITTTMSPDTTVRCLSDFIWSIEQSHCDKYIARHNRWSRRAGWFTRLFHRPKHVVPCTVPIMPSTLCFDMRCPETYGLFRSGNISAIHVDIMDGLYVEKLHGSIEELAFIRSQTNAHLHVHLMTESPTVWAADAIAAGANTIIMSTNTSGLIAAIQNVRAAGVRAGIALHPKSSVQLLKDILRDIDEVMVMSVIPGAAGQTFDTSALKKISILAATRRKYGLKFKISVDGGINDKTAQLCWAAGADILVSGSYLATAPDFPLAVQSLLPKSVSQN